MGKEEGQPLHLRSCAGSIQASRALVWYSIIMVAVTELGVANNHLLCLEQEGTVLTGEC